MLKNSVEPEISVALVAAVLDSMDHWTELSLLKCSFLDKVITKRFEPSAHLIFCWEQLLY